MPSVERTQYCDICLWSSKCKIENGAAKQELFRHHLSMHVDKENKFRFAYLQRRSKYKRIKKTRLQCDCCPQVSTTKTNAFTHFVASHSNLSKSDKQIYRHRPIKGTTTMCDVCLREICADNLYRHFLTKHMMLPDVDKHNCDHCEYASLESRKLVTHWFAVHTAPTSEEHKKSVQCDICHKEFRYDGTVPNRSNVYQHFLIQHSETAEKFVCDVCNHVSTAAYSLWKHVSWAGHMAQPEFGKLACDICSVEFHHKKSVLYHHRLKHGKKEELDMFDCEHCGFSTNIKFLLNAHIMEQCMVNDVRYQCENCKRLFNTRMALYGHTRHGHKKTLYVCDGCDRSYYRKETILLHCTNFVV